MATGSADEMLVILYTQQKHASMLRTLAAHRLLGCRATESGYSARLKRTRRDTANGDSRETVRTAELRDVMSLRA